MPMPPRYVRPRLEALMMASSVGLAQSETMRDGDFAGSTKVADET